MQENVKMYTNTYIHHLCNSYFCSTGQQCDLYHTHLLPWDLQRDGIRPFGFPTWSLSSGGPTVSILFIFLSPVMLQMSRYTGNKNKYSHILFIAFEAIDLFFLDLKRPIMLGSILSDTCGFRRALCLNSHLSAGPGVNVWWNLETPV